MAPEGRGFSWIPEVPASPWFPPGAALGRAVLGRELNDEVTLRVGTRSLHYEIRALA